ncbi:unnamed protein product [Adineta steineri]|uniref:Cullin family profile domain-containing protein n=1 Tax=Adineta steineri TaxID=433720 RepID=A0A816DWW5_9BILA|nr:unnamed protein product [Adineta steineri]CAF1644598.1 unnamed protein product [Adineta steineri]
MDFYNRSFTVEAWIYPSTISTGNPYVDMVIYAQTSATQIYQVMYMMLRNGTGYGAFYGDDVQGSTIFQALEWQHIAFTYDYTMTTQVIYINGVADAINYQAPPCLSTGGIQTIGVYTSYNGGFYNGYIDQLEISLGRAKSAAEILDDATLVVYYSMDDPNNPGGDSGPNQITGVASGPFSSDQGRVGQSLLFYPNSSYIQITGLVLLGQSYSPFSVAVWIRPLISVTNGGTIVHFSDHLEGTGFCFPFIGLSSSGQIIVQIFNGGVPAITGPVLTVGQCNYVGRKLTLLHRYSEGELQIYFTREKHRLKVSTYQMVILLLFNEELTWTFEQIQDKTQIHSKLLLKILSGLLKSDLLISDNPLTVNSRIELATNFLSNKIRLNINLPSKAEEQKDRYHFTKAAVEERRMFIQAVLVRIMKKKQTLKQSLLIQEVIQQLTSRFKPDIYLIETCIEKLIACEYFRRDSNNNDTLHYLP